MDYQRLRRQLSGLGETMPKVKASQAVFGRPSFNPEVMVLGLNKERKVAELLTQDAMRKHHQRRQASRGNTLIDALIDQQVGNLFRRPQIYSY
jgi:hypothetical protein